MYTISFSDPNTTKVLNIPDDSINTETSLKLYGQNYDQYGEMFWENLLHLVENFCNTTEPKNPVTGQLWYNSNNKTLRVFDKTWNEISKTVTVNTSKYIRKDVDNVAFNLYINKQPLVATDAATKLYVSNYHGGIITKTDVQYSYILYPNKWIIVTGLKSGVIQFKDFEMADNNYGSVSTNTNVAVLPIITDKHTKGFTCNTTQWMVVGFIK